MDNWKVRPVSDDTTNVNNRTIRDDLTKEQIEEVQTAQKELLGPRELRTNGAPTIDLLTKTRVGGAAIERTCRNSDKCRSHTYGPSREKITKIVAPPASSKVRENGAEWDENLKMRNNTLKVSLYFYSSSNIVQAIRL